MLRIKLLVFAILLVTGPWLIGQDDDKLLSGPRPGAFLPASFECMNINGPAKGRPHCLVCKFALSPSVLIFATEPGEGKDEAITDFLKKLDEVATEFEDRNFSAGIIFLTNDGRDSTNNAQEEKSEELIKEALAREKLTERLTKRAEGLKHVIVAYCVPEQPKRFNINPKAEYTIVFYDRMKVIENWTYAPEKLEAADVGKMVKRIREVLPLRKKEAPKA